ncbi:MAG: PEP-CTERM sorting domain-containing protein [Phycisphaerales bacterium]|nr:PEP-CTERM sorting domain-containing protein [Phycisphaerales bacterium]
MKRSFALILTASLATITNAEIIQVDIMGTVDFGGVPNGQWAGAQSGDTVVQSFQLDSNVFVDSTNFPVRGYEVIASSFSLSIGGNTAGMADPYPAGLTPYFVIRNDDPAVDGFFMTHNIDGFEEGIFTDEAANLDPTFGTIFNVAYEQERLDSLDIMGAVGTYDFTGLSVFNWGLSDAFVQPMGFIFDEWTISVVPAPSALALIGFAGIATTRRRR